MKRNSWEMIDKDTLLKKTDRSFFIYRGSGIPKNLLSFFHLENLAPGHNKYISLYFEGREYKGRIIKDASDHGQTRIFWNTELSKVFNSLYHYSEENPENSPYIKFEKENKNRYVLSFIDGESPNIQEDRIVIDRKERGVLSIYPDEVKSVKGIKEGSIEHVIVNRYERSKKAREICIKKHGSACAICDFDFSKKYGRDLRNVIHVHHLIPLSELGKEYEVDPVKDLVPVCPNCHLVIHKDPKKVKTIEEVKRMLSDAKSM